jgi:hypothetical protein
MIVPQRGEASSTRTGHEGDSRSFTGIGSRRAVCSHPKRMRGAHIGTAQPDRFVAGSSSTMSHPRGRGCANVPHSRLASADRGAHDLYKGVMLIVKQAKGGLFNAKEGAVPGIPII